LGQCFIPLRSAYRLARFSPEIAEPHRKTQIQAAEFVRDNIIKTENIAQQDLLNLISVLREGLAEAQPGVRDIFEAAFFGLARTGWFPVPVFEKRISHQGLNAMPQVPRSPRSEMRQAKRRGQGLFGKEPRPEEYMNPDQLRQHKATRFEMTERINDPVSNLQKLNMRSFLNASMPIPHSAKAWKIWRTRNTPTERVSQPYATGRLPRSRSKQMAG